MPPSPEAPFPRLGCGREGGGGTRGPSPRLDLPCPAQRQLGSFLRRAGRSEASA